MVLNDQEGAVETKVSKTNVTGCIIPNTINTKDCIINIFINIRMMTCTKLGNIGTPASRTLCPGIQETATNETSKNYCKQPTVV